MSNQPDEFRTAHQITHDSLVELARFPPLTRKQLRKRYRDLLKNWRHDRLYRIYASEIAEAQNYYELSNGDQANAHMFYFERVKDSNPDDYIY